MNQTFRPPQIDLASILSSQTPEIDLRISSWEASTRNFLKAVSDYTKRAVTEIDGRRSNYLAEKKKLADKIQAVQEETNQCKVNEIQLLASLEKEREEAKEAEASVAVLRRQLASAREACASLDSEIEHYEAVTNNLRREKGGERDTIHNLSSAVMPELYACASVLGCTIEGIGRDQILFQFTSINPKDPHQQFTLALDISGNAYKVLSSNPQLPTLPILAEELNETRDIYAFIKSVRQSFVQSVT